MRRKQYFFIEIGIAVFVLFLGAYVMVPKFLKAQNINLPTKIPDLTFRRYLEQQLNVGIDEPYTAEEAAKLKTIEIRRFNPTQTALPKRIQSLKGIHYFTGLESVSLNGVDCETIDLTSNGKIKELTISNSNLHTIDLSPLPLLENMDCSNNKLNALDVSKNPGIIWLSCYGNQISELNLSKNPKLEFLEASRNPLETIDLSHNPVLQNVRLNECNLKEINVSNITQIINLEVYLNYLDAIPPMEQHRELKYLDLRNNDLDCGDMDDVMQYRKRLGIMSILILPQNNVDLEQCEGYDLF